MLSKIKNYLVLIPFFITIYFMFYTDISNEFFYNLFLIGLFTVIFIACLYIKFLNKYLIFIFNLFILLFIFNYWFVVVFNLLINFVNLRLFLEILIAILIIIYFKKVDNE